MLPKVKVEILIESNFPTDFSSNNGFHTCNNIRAESQVVSIQFVPVCSAASVMVDAVLATLGIDFVLLKFI